MENSHVRARESWSSVTTLGVLPQKRKEERDERERKGMPIENSRVCVILTREREREREESRDTRISKRE